MECVNVFNLCLSLEMGESAGKKGAKNVSETNWCPIQIRKQTVLLKSARFEESDKAINIRSMYWESSILDELIGSICIKPNGRHATLTAIHRNNKEMVKVSCLQWSVHGLLGQLNFHFTNGWLTNCENYVYLILNSNNQHSIPK